MQWGLLLLSVLNGGWTSAEPYVPTSDDEVIERLPPGVRSADFRRQREELAVDPENLRDSVEMARGYLDTARSEGDVRYRAYAQAILGPWWAQPTPPGPVLVQRARIRADAWEFDQALADLAQLRQGDRLQPEAARVRYEVMLARGDVAGAARWLDESKGAWKPLGLAIARAKLGRFGDQAEAAYAALVEASAQAPLSDLEGRHEALRELGDLAESLGHLDAAEAHDAALAKLGRRDVESLARRADYLLARGRFEAAASMLAEEAAVDGLAVRWLEAIRHVTGRSKDDEARREALTLQVRERFEARRRRADATALADEPRYRLRVLGDAAGAFDAARSLWAVRRLPVDARWLLECAVAAGRPEGGQPAVEWARTNGLRDARWAALLPGSGGAR